MLFMRVQSPNEAKLLFNVNDDVEKHIKTDRSNFVQWVTQYVENNKMFVLIAVEDDEIKAYLVAIDNTLPPLSTSALLAYVWNSGITEAQMMVMKTKLFSWAKSRGIKSIKAGTHLPAHVFEKYGFKETGKVIEANIE